MSLEMLLAQFDGLIQTPADVAQLNETILDWAVRGKLVPQDPTDEPASELLKRIAAEKARLVEEGKIRAEKPLPPVREEEMPYELPAGWAWVRLSEIAFVGTGATPLRANPRYWEGGTIAWVTSSATGEPYISKASEFVTEVALAETNLQAYPENTLLVAMYGQGKTRGQVSELLIEATVNQACAAILFDGMAAGLRNYIKLFLSKSYDDLRNLAAGGAQPNLNLGKIKLTCISLPPLAEQKRIVAKVEVLLAQTERLAGQLAAAEEARRRLNTATLYRLTAPTTTAGDGARAAWEVLAAQFDDLYTGPETIDALKQAILQLAVQGRLVRQDPYDEPASELLKRIAAEKARLVEEGKIRAEKPLPPVREEDVPYEVPAGWQWTWLGNVATNIHYGYTASADFRIQDVRMLRISDIQNNRVNWSIVPGCAIEKDKLQDYLLNDGDLLIARTGGTIGKSYLVSGVTVDAVFASYLIRVIPAREILPSYAKLFLESPFYWQQLIDKSKGTGQPNVNATSLRQLAMPLSPLAEQKRIVAKVEALFAQTERLAAQLAAAAEARERLLAAVLARAREG